MFEDLKQTFRWFGPNDQVTLAAIRQTGATGIVTALHHIECGEVWGSEQINDRKQEIEKSGLNWPVVESVNVHESIKTGTQNRDHFIDNYIITLRNLAGAGIATVCYNFMPVLDWTRTDLDYRLFNNASALRFDAVAMAAFDLFILERDGAFAEYSEIRQSEARKYFDIIDNHQREQLRDNIMAGLPGTNKVLTVDEFKTHLQQYAEVDAGTLRNNLAYFLKAVIPEAEKAGVKMCIHPDDPPFPILGLPRVVSTEQDLEDVVNYCPSPSNGVTFCSGSLGARADNDLPGIVTRLGKHIHFLHLRNVQREADGSFYEADHLAGSTDMFAVMKNVLMEQKNRTESGKGDIAIPMRPDHGHKLLYDINYKTYHGYSVIGRLKALAELRGLELGIKRSLFSL